MSDTSDRKRQIMHKWQDAHVGSESPQMAVRVTEEEKQRLEQLRRELRLTSKGQVIRAALDLLEVLNTPNEFIMGGPDRVRKVWEEHPEFVERVVRRFGGLAEGPDADAPGGAAEPVTGQAEEDAAA